MAAVMMRVWMPERRMRSSPSGAARTHTTVIGWGRAALHEEAARVLERASGGQHRIEDEAGPVLQPVRQLGQVGGGEEGLLVPGQTHEADLRRGEEP